jgi:hypothetical protein
MRPDNNDLFLVIGYDLRMAQNNPKRATSSIQVSADPTIWISAREVSPNTICNMYGVDRLTDMSNGLNLAFDPLPVSAPEHFIWAAFDAPKWIVEYMSSCFGLQNSLNRDSHILLDEGFVLLGYDVIDLWTQTSALFQYTDMNYDNSKINQWQLFQDRASAREASKRADKVCPTSAPFQPVGVWILTRKMR